MKRVLAMLAAIALGPSSGMADDSTVGIEGTYRYCNRACVEIEIRSDSTFAFRRYGHLEASKVEGHWTSVDERVVVASSNEPPPLKSPTPIASGLEAFRIRVVDEMNESLPGALIAVDCGGQTVSALADRRGETTFGPCGESKAALTVELDGFRTSAFEVSTASEGYVVEMAAATIEISEELWYIADGELLILDHMPLPKVSEP